MGALQTRFGTQALEVSHLVAKYALEASMTLGHHALVAGQDASMYLGRQAQHVAVQSLPLIADAADGAHHLATEAVSTSFGKFKNCLQREDTSSSVASDDDSVAELPLS